MKKINIDVERIGNIIKTGGRLAVCAAVVILPYAKDISDKMRCNGPVKYSDVVNVILNSCMMSSYKTELIELLPKNAESDLYRTVIHVINSDMLSSNKVKVIKDICGVISEEES